MSLMRWSQVHRVPMKVRNFVSTLRTHLLKPRLTEVSSVYFCSTNERSNTSDNNPFYHQKQVISDFIRAHNEAEPEEWTNLRREITQISEIGLSDENIDFSILQHCLILRKKLPLARSYLNYMKSLKKKVDGAIACEFLKLCHSRKAYLEEEDFQRVISFTNFLQRKYTSVDSYIGEGIIKGLLVQNRINDCFQTLGLIKERDEVTEPIYSALVIYAIENDQYDYLRKWIDEITARYPLSRKICSIWIEHFSENRSMLDKLLTIFHRLVYLPEKHVCDNLLNCYVHLPSPEKLLGQYGTIQDNGQCSVCGEHLNRTRANDDEFKMLGKSFMNNVLVGSDVYTYTKPYELKKFHSLMDQYGPFKLIIDGLNVAYRLGFTGEPSSYVRGIERVFSQLRLQKPDDRILFVGKQHMRKWPGLLDLIRHFDAQYFFVENDSDDDMYIISAALHCGGLVVSNDDLKNEKVRLNQKEFSLFERWKQCSLISVMKHHDETIELLFPFPFERVVQSTRSGGWHIPYRTKKYRGLPSDIFRNWLCLRSAESI